ncbi:MAG: hypothetical protein ABIL88_05825 [candidate division WOR-3 bacterium]
MRGFLKSRFVDIVIFFAIFGLLITLAELFTLEHFHKIQMVAPVVSGLSAILMILGFFVGALRFPIFVILLLLSPSGIFGMFEHWEHASEEETAYALEIYQTVNGEKYEGEEKEEKPPIFAPLSLTGLILLGVLGLFVKEK